MAIHVAFIIRFVSYVYNAIFVSGAVAFASEGVTGIGPCQTVFQPYMIYQEHCISVLYEFVLVFILGLYAAQQSAKDSFMFSDLLRKIMDFEMYCFAFYLFIEIVFLFVYALSPKNLVSVILFFAATLNILERKSESYDSSKNPSEGKIHISSTHKSKGASTTYASKDVPSVFSTKDNVDVPSAFGKSDPHHVVPKSISVKDVQYEGMDLATLILYTMSVVFELGVLIYLLILRKTLQPMFCKLATISTLCILVGFSLSLFGYVTTNGTIECTINRKISYSIRYVGFYMFDLSQARKFFRIYAYSSRPKILLIYAALAIRLVSYLINALLVTGAVAFLSKNSLTNGPCQTSFAPYLIYQEHIISVGFELVLLGILFSYSMIQRHNGLLLSDLLKKIMDFEMYSFAFYFVMEILYLIAYTCFPKTFVSVLNIFYLQIPVVLFFANTLNNLRRKRDVSSMDGVNFPNPMVKSIPGEKLPKDILRMHKASEEATIKELRPLKTSERVSRQ
ncbi:hypothetical protein HDV06_004086 [Boothiomyces sp. JEL0866]|nr:hypothetical protein HDV06_004086 [Boothiomyces sp. JEL0866]